MMSARAVPRHHNPTGVSPMAALLRSWARRALRLARDMQDVSPVSAANEAVTSFARAEDVDRGWHAWSDEPHGGTSRATLSWVPRAEGMGDAGDDDVGAMVLEGYLSTKTVAPLTASASDEPLPEPVMDKTNFELRVAAAESAARADAAAAAHNRAQGADKSAPSSAPSSAPTPHVTKSLRRSGFAGCSTRPLPEGEFVDLDAFTALRFRVRSDGRVYVASIRTDNWVTGRREDIWQAFLFAPANRWADVIVPMDRFLKTWRGRVMEHEHEMSASRVVGLGIAVAGGGAAEGSPEGPFRLEVASITGLRLSREELEMARRRAEAAWGAAAGPDLGFAASELRRAAGMAGEDVPLVPPEPKTKWKGAMLPGFLGRKPGEEDA